MQFVICLKNLPQLSLGRIAQYKDLITYVKDRPGHDVRYAIDTRRKLRMN